MRQTASEILSKHGISLRSFRYGNQKIRCPKCSDGRRNKREPCLSVEVADEGVRWNCHNCGDHGGEFYDQRREPYPRAKTNKKRAPDRAVRNFYR